MVVVIYKCHYILYVAIFLPIYYGTIKYCLGAGLTIWMTDNR
jgi:hypothetical protein